MSKQEQPTSDSREDAQSPVAARWPDPASALAAADEQSKAAFAVPRATPDVDARAAIDPLASASSGAMDKSDAPAVSKAGTLAAKRTDSLYSLFWAFCGAFILVALSGGATYFMTGTREQRGWPAKPFDVAQSASWLDRSVSTLHPNVVHGADALHDIPHVRRSASRLG